MDPCSLLSVAATITRPSLRASVCRRHRREHSLRQLAGASAHDGAGIDAMTPGAVGGDRFRGRKAAGGAVSARGRWRSTALASNVDCQQPPDTERRTPREGLLVGVSGGKTDHRGLD
jgi:hypothetical protein